MTAKEYNECVLGDDAVVELADAMTLGRLDDLDFKVTEYIGDFCIYRFDNGTVYVFKDGNVRANVRVPRFGFGIELSCSSMTEAIRQARAFGIANYIASKYERR